MDNQGDWPPLMPQTWQGDNVGVGPTWAFQGRKPDACGIAHGNHDVTSNRLVRPSHARIFDSCNFIEAFDLE